MINELINKYILVEQFKNHYFSPIFAQYLCNNICEIISETKISQMLLHKISAQQSINHIYFSMIPM